MKTVLSVIIVLLLSAGSSFALDVKVRNTLKELGNDKYNWCKIKVSGEQDPAVVVATIRNGDFIILMLPAYFPCALTQAHFDEAEMKNNDNPLELAGRFLIFSSDTTPYDYRIVHVRADSSLAVLDENQAQKIEKMFR